MKIACLFKARPVSYYSPTVEGRRVPKVENVFDKIVFYVRVFLFFFSLHPSAWPQNVGLIHSSFFDVLDKNQREVSLWIYFSIFLHFFMCFMFACNHTQPSIYNLLLPVNKCITLKHEKTFVDLKSNSALLYNEGHNFWKSIFYKNYLLQVWAELAFGRQKNICHG